ncbi:MAG: hypothetical protein RI886_849 [Pseudomonadota bacterium]|jgi:hypothetical protein
MENNPQILHLSYRESEPDNDYKWLYVNLVFKVTDEFDIIACKGRAEEWTKTILYEVEDAEEIHNHFLHTRYKFNKIENSELSELSSYTTEPEFDISNKKRSGLALNPHHILQYIEKFDVFVFREYVEDNFITRAALSMLKDLEENKKTGSRFVPFSTFIRCVDTLNVFWD